MLFESNLRSATEEHGGSAGISDRESSFSTFLINSIFVVTYFVLLFCYTYFVLLFYFTFFFQTPNLYIPLNCPFADV